MNYNQINKNYWDVAAKIHMKAPKGYYDIEGFNQGYSSLKQVHLDELGDVKGKKILHLLCHIGLDSLSLARLGAEVTGIDISEESVISARSLAEKNNLDANFICSDVYDFNIDDKFDIVFASHGVTCWLKDLDAFMDQVKCHLKDDGFFYLMDGHPISMTMQKTQGRVSIARNYFLEHSEPHYSSSSEDYAFEGQVIDKPLYEWSYTMSDILNAVGNSGLTLTMMNEHDFCDDNYFGDMVQDHEGWWHFNNRHLMPLMFSLKAKKL